MTHPERLRRRQVRAALLLDVLVADQMLEPPRSVELRSLAASGIRTDHFEAKDFALDRLLSPPLQWSVDAERCPACDSTRIAHDRGSYCLACLYCFDCRGAGCPGCNDDLYWQAEEALRQERTRPPLP